MKIKLQYTLFLMVILLSVLNCKAQFTGVEASYTPASIVGFGDSYQDITFKSGISIGVFKWKTVVGFYTFNYEYNSLSKSYSSNVENISVLVNFQDKITYHKLAFSRNYILVGELDSRVLFYLIQGVSLGVFKIHYNEITNKSQFTPDDLDNLKYIYYLQDENLSMFNISYQFGLGFQYNISNSLGIKTDAMISYGINNPSNADVMMQANIGIRYRPLFLY